MRFIIPSYSLADNFTENVAFTLRQMGHTVLSAPVPSKVMNQKMMHVMQLGYEKFLPNWLPPQEKWLLRTYRDFKPDMMIALTHSVSEETLLTLQKAGVRNVAWWGDSPAQMRKQGLLCNGWDLIFLKDKFAVSKLRTLDLNAYFLPEAMNPEWHRINHGPIGNDVVLAGNAYDYRHYLVRRLLAEGCSDVKLYGFRPSRWSAPEVVNAFQGKYIVREEKSRIFGEGLICINSTSMLESNTINCRAFEIAGAGGLQVMEYRPAIEDCFEIGKEILTYSSIAELMDQISFHRRNPDASHAIRQAGHARAHAEHTYRHRLETIIKMANL
jgi:spore maturation protein CgeB